MRAPVDAEAVARDEHVDPAGRDPEQRERHRQEGEVIEHRRGEQPRDDDLEQHVRQADQEQPGEQGSVGAHRGSDATSGAGREELGLADPGLAVGPQRVAEPVE